MNPTEAICSKARDLGFNVVGIVPAHPTPRYEAYRAWIALGYHGDMHYLARAEWSAMIENPSRTLARAQTILCVGLNYAPSAEAPQDPGRGRIANCARGNDYHPLMLRRLEELAAFVRAETGREITYRACVDSGPVLERAWAAEAGLGFIGKNSCLIHPRMGSWLLLGELVLDCELEPTSERIEGDCGDCRRCLEACPTGALVAPYVVDARRCIAYLTVESKGSIPRDLRPLLGNRIYGCDCCQEVCPWQRHARPTRERALDALEPDRIAPMLTSLMALDEQAFRQLYAGRAIARLKRKRLLRNVAVALGNWGDEKALPVLAAALADREPLVRGHAAWALGRIGGPAARQALEKAWQNESHPDVQQEIQFALEEVIWNFHN